MKHMKRSGRYQASNVFFDPEKMTAYSYGWWCFVKVINGKLIFNGYRYSNSTSRHQWKVRRLLADLGLTIDREVSFRENMEAINDLKTIAKLEKNEKQIVLANLERKRKQRNESARLRRAEKKAKAMAQSLLPKATSIEPFKIYLVK